MLPRFSLDRQIQSIVVRRRASFECKGFEPFNVKTLHLICEKRLKTLAVNSL
jgi:hypothetical protein